MRTTYVVYDQANRRMESFAGPRRLARWADFPDGWTIERFLGDVSQGSVSFDDVRKHAAELDRMDRDVGSEADLPERLRP